MWSVINLIVLVLVGLGAIGVSVSAVVCLSQEGLSKKQRLGLLLLSLAALGAILSAIAVYERLPFGSFTSLMTGVLVLITAAFSILRWFHR